MPQWLWSLGIAYDRAASSYTYRNPNTAFDRQWRYATGLQYALRDKITLGLAYELMDLGTARMNAREETPDGPDYRGIPVKFSQFCGRQHQVAILAVASFLAAETLEGVWPFQPSACENRC